MTDLFSDPCDRLRTHWPRRMQQATSGECDALIASLDPELQKKIYRNIRTDEDVAQFRAKLKRSLSGSS